MTDEKNALLLGREQALLLGKRLAENELKFDVVVTSSMQRAIETAELMLSLMAPIPRKIADSILDEGSPYPPEPPSRSRKPIQKMSFSFYTFVV